MLEDRLAVGMEDVRPVLVDQEAGFIVSVIGIAADMRPTVDQKHLFVTLAREPFGNDAAGEPGADHEPIKHGRLRSQIALLAPSPVLQKTAPRRLPRFLSASGPPRSARSLVSRSDPTKSARFGD